MPDVVRSLRLLCVVLFLALAMSHAVAGQFEDLGVPVHKAALLETIIGPDNTGTKDMAKHVASADIVVAAAGVPHVISPDIVKPGAVLVDVGITRTDAGLVGDIDPACAEVAGWIAPMPGGTGPMTRAMLLANVVEAAERS